MQIAYAMKHLNIPLVDAYLIVRSRRLSVLIQPNMRLLYNLCGWEIKLARERAGDDPHKLRFELAVAVCLCRDELLQVPERCAPRSARCCVHITKAG